MGENPRTLEVGHDGAAFSDPFNIKDVMSTWGYQIGTIDSEAFLPVKETHETEEAYIQVGHIVLVSNNLAQNCRFFEWKKNSGDNSSGSNRLL